MIVVADTGPLYALVDRSDAWHQRVTTWRRARTREVVVPVTVLPEVCYLLQTRISAAAENAFVRSVAVGEFVMESLSPTDVDRASVLMLEYADLPPGVVDATVIAMAERLDAREILTTDRRHFGVVRSAKSGAMRLVP